MTFLEICRNQAYWLIDSLRGGKVKRAIKVIEKCDKGIWSQKEIEDYQQNAIAKLLNHTKNTVDAYKSVNSEKLEDWPIVTKAEIRENLDRYISNLYDNDKLIVMSTSGSTGVPFRCYQDVNKKRHVNAETIYFNGLVNFKIGRKIIYFRSIFGEVTKSKLVQFAQNIALIDCLDLSDEGVKEKIAEIRKCSANGGGLILGYASTIDAFRKYFDKYGYDKAEGCKVYGVVSGSEMLHDVTRNGIEKAFGCKMVSRYANEENGFLGQDDEDNNVFIPNRADYYYEILKLDSNEPAADGEVGRIVVTDLYNYAMPFVRYDTGDVGAWVYTMHFGKKVKAIGNFGGRVVDMIFDTRGEQISPFTINNSMLDFSGIKQYQFTQKDKKQYLLKIVLEKESFNQEERLLEMLHTKFGADADLKIEYCNEIPKLKSGKTRYIINEMISKNNKI